MKHRYTLNSKWIDKISDMVEFRNGGTQVTIELKDGTLFSKALISNCTHIIALRGYKSLPFSICDIASIYQKEEDKKPIETGNWDYWG